MLKKTKRKIIIWTVIIITAINFLLILAFFIYLYFWLKTRIV